MKGKYWLLPALTVAAVLFAVALPELMLLQWSRNHMEILYQEPVDKTALVTDYSLGGSARLRLLRDSGVRASGGAILYGDAGSGITVDVRTLRLDSGEEDPQTGEENGGRPALLPNKNFTEHLYHYYYEALYLLVDHGVIGNDLLLHYQKTAESVKVDYCTVTNMKNPFSSMSLLCVSCSLRDGESYGLSSDTAFSLILDEETGVVYGLSVIGDPEFVLAEDPLRFSVLADLQGVSMTEYEQLPAKQNTESARFNFGGYSYLLQQTVREDGTGLLEFNPEKNPVQGAAP